MPFYLPVIGLQHMSVGKVEMPIFADLSKAVHGGARANHHQFPLRGLVHAYKGAWLVFSFMKSGCKTFINSGMDRLSNVTEVEA